MRRIDRAGFFVVACLCAAIAGCGSTSRGSADASEDGPVGDGGGGPEADVIEAGDDAPADAPSDVVVPGDAGDDATNEVDASVGTVTITADASLRVTGMAGGECAAASSLRASPNVTAVGHTISLLASGVDPDNQSSDVTLTWTATGSAGSLQATTGMSNTFTCTSAGTATVTVVAAIASGGASCAGIGSLAVTLTCDAP
jgi:hypothetical protein